MVRAHRSAQKVRKEKKKTSAKVSDDPPLKKKRSGADLWKAARAKGLAVARLKGIPSKEKKPLTQNDVRQTAVHLRLNNLDAETAAMRNEIDAIRTDVTSMKDELEKLVAAVQKLTT